MWVRTDARQRVRSLIVLAFLIALASGVVIAALAGARRNGTAPDRLAARGNSADVYSLPNLEGMNWEKVRALPYVEDVGTFALAFYDVKGTPFGTGFLPPTSPAIGHTIERGVIVAGRRADPERLDEVIVTPAAAKEFGYHVGSQIELRGWNAAKVQQYMQSADEIVPDGPVVRATVVGIVKSPFFGVGLESEDGQGGIVPSYKWYQQYHANMGTFGEQINALVKLKHGNKNVAQFSRDVNRIAGRPVENQVLNENLAEIKKATSLERTALVAFAIAAAIAAVVLIGQAIIRLVAASASELTVLGALGLTRRQRSVALAIAPAIAVGIGAVLGVGVAYLLSPRFPIGNGRHIEPAPGYAANWAILGIGFVVAFAVALIGVFATASWYVRRNERAAPVAPTSSIAAAVSNAGAPVPMALGAQMALDRGRGRTAVPVIPAIAGVIVGVLGVVGVLTFRVGLDHALTDNKLYGQQNQAASSREEPDQPSAAFTKKLLAQPGVAVVNRNAIAVAAINDRPVTVFTSDALKGDVSITTLRGRPPRAADEIVVAPADAKPIHARVGDTVRVGDKGARFRVVGIGFTPVDSHTTYNQGAWVTAAGHHEIAPTASDDKYLRYDVVFANRVNPANGIKQLSQAMDYEFDPAPPPEAQANLKGVRHVPLALGAFLVLLGIAAVGHALASSVRRRRRDIAVLRTLGMTRGQTRLMVVWQATTLALVGLLFGIPLGLILGRVIWHNVANSTPIVYRPPVALIVLLLIGPLVIIATNLLAALPARRAARLRAAEVLRTE
jgi:ABC-type lipoprotein release transport system permease subunit